LQLSEALENCEICSSISHLFSGTLFGVEVHQGNIAAVMVHAYPMGLNQSVLGCVASFVAQKNS